MLRNVNLLTYCSRYRPSDMSRIPNLKITRKLSIELVEVYLGCEYTIDKVLTVFRISIVD